MPAGEFFDVVNESYTEEDLQNRIKKMSKHSHKTKNGKIVTTIPML